MTDKPPLLSACICGAPKLPKQVFCTHCYLTLPSEIRRKLIGTYGETFELAYGRAIAWLADRFGAAGRIA